MSRHCNNISPNRRCDAISVALFGRSAWDHTFPCVSAAMHVSYQAVASMEVRTLLSIEGTQAIISIVWTAVQCNAGSWGACEAHSRVASLPTFERRHGRVPNAAPFGYRTVRCATIEWPERKPQRLLLFIALLGGAKGIADRQVKAFPFTASLFSLQSGHRHDHLQTSVFHTS
jgi:hypothetical protein